MWSRYFQARLPRVCTLLKWGTCHLKNWRHRKSSLLTGFQCNKRVACSLQACRGMRMIYSQKVTLVPIKEMTDVLSVEKKSVEIDQNTWIRVKTGIYKGDLAKVIFCFLPFLLLWTLCRTKVVKLLLCCFLTIWKLVVWTTLQFLSCVFRWLMWIMYDSVLKSS